MGWGKEVGSRKGGVKGRGNGESDFQVEFLGLERPRYPDGRKDFGRTLLNFLFFLD